MGGAGGFLDKLKKEGTRRGPTEDREGLSRKDMERLYSTFLAFLFCFTRELKLYSPLTFSLRPPIHPYLTHRPPIHPSAPPSATHPSTLLSVACYTPPLPSPSTYLSAHTSHTTNSSLLLSAKSKPRLLALREEVLGIKVLRVPGPAVQGRSARAPSSA